MEFDEDEAFESEPKRTKKEDPSNANNDKLEIVARPMKKRLIDLYSQSSKGELEVLTPRFGFTATLVPSSSSSNSNSQIWIVGGKDEYKTFDEIFTLDTGNFQCRKQNLKGKFSPRESHTATLLSDGKRILVFGGRTENDDIYNDVVVIDTGTLTIENKTTSGVAPAPRSSHAAALIGDFVLIFGGCDHDQDFNDLLILDTKTFTWISPVSRGQPPAARCGHSINQIATSDRFLLFGGSNIDGEYFNDVWILQVNFPDGKCTATWTKFKQQFDYKLSISNIREVSEHASLNFGDWILFIGGETERGPTNQVLSFNTRDDVFGWGESFMVSPSLPKLSDLTAFQIKQETILIIGFEDSHSQSSLILLEPGTKLKSKYVDIRIHSLLHYFNNPFFSDVAFIVQGQKIFAQKSILAKSCSYFRGMFSHGMKEATLSEIKVTEDVQFETYFLLLKSCYKVDISKSISSFEIAQELWQLGEMMMYDDLKEITVNSLGGLLSRQNIEMFAPFFGRNSDLRGPLDLPMKKYCIDFITKHPQVIKDIPESFAFDLFDESFNTRWSVGKHLLLLALQYHIHSPKLRNLLLRMNSSELDVEHIPSITQALDVCIKACITVHDHVSKQTFNEGYDFMAVLEKLFSFLCELSGYQIEEGLLLRIVDVFNFWLEVMHKVNSTDPNSNSASETLSNQHEIISKYWIKIFRIIARNESLFKATMVILWSRAEKSGDMLSIEAISFVQKKILQGAHGEHILSVRGDTAFDIALTKVSDIVYGFDKPDLNPELLLGMSVLSNFSALAPIRLLEGGFAFLLEVLIRKIDSINPIVDLCIDCCNNMVTSVRAAMAYDPNRIQFHYFEGFVQLIAGDHVPSLYFACGALYTLLSHYIGGDQYIHQIIPPLAGAMVVISTAKIDKNISLAFSAICNLMITCMQYYPEKDPSVSQSIELVKSAGIPKIMEDIILNPISTAEMKNNAIRVLQILANDEKTIIDIGALVFEELLNCMSKPDSSSDVRSSIYQLVRSIIKQKIGSQVTSPNMLMYEFLLNVLREKAAHPEIKNDALRTLRSLRNLCEDGHSAFLEKSGLTTTLVQLLKANVQDQGIVIEAIHVLSTFYSKCNDNISVIGGFAGLSLLIQLLKHYKNDIFVSETICEYLQNLLFLNDDSVDIFISLQGLEAIQMVLSSSKDPLESASKVIEACNHSLKKMST